MCLGIFFSEISLPFLCNLKDISSCFTEKKAYQKVLISTFIIITRVDWTVLFPTADVNLGLIRYVLNDGGVQETTDNFKFLVKDSKPNIVSDNVFHIQWSLISFEYSR